MAKINLDEAIRNFQQVADAQHAGLDQASADFIAGDLDALEAAIGTAPLLRIYSGSMPANCATAATGTLLAEMTLPSDWLTTATSGSKAKN